MDDKEIVLCMGSSCYTRGNDQTLSSIQEFLLKNKLEKKITFRGELCSCNCKNGPNIKIGDKVYPNIGPTSAIKIIKSQFKVKTVK